jgi:isopentenyl phosphate kinase
MENMETLAEDHIENLDQWIKDKETEGFMIVHGAS